MVKNFFRLLAIFVAAFILAFSVTYLNLDIGEEPKEADVIIVFEGTVGERQATAAKLFQEGYSSENIVVVSPYYEFQGVGLDQIYQVFGLPPENILFEEAATSTWTNATNTQAIMEEKGWDSAIIVSSDYHMRRSRLSMKRAADDPDQFDFTYVSAYPQDEDGQPYTYRDSEYGRNMAVAEVYKYWGYLLGLYHVIDL